MKKALLSPLLSGLVIPGLGQAVNGHLKKALVLLGLVLGILVLAFFSLYRMVFSTVDGSPPGSTAERLDATGTTMFWYLLAAFAVLWLYSIWDAYRAGRRLDRSGWEK